MILKYLDNDNSWTWLGGVKEISKIGYRDPDNIEPGDYGVTAIDIIGTGTSDPLVLRLETEKEGVKLLAVYARQAYLCNSENGNTIDVLI